MIQNYARLFRKIFLILCNLKKFLEFCGIRETCKTLDIRKRNLLKTLAMFYDPIGLLQPILINLKRLFQGICKQKLSCDDLLPDDFRREFEKTDFFARYGENFHWQKCFATNGLLTRNRISWFQRRKFAKLQYMCLYKGNLKIRSF